jgi:N-acetylneuraminate lyase
MHNNGTLNAGLIRSYAEFYIRNEVDGAFICGTSGEGTLLTISERKILAEAWISESPEHFKNIIHIGGPSMEESRALAQHAIQIGAYGTAVMAPCFFKPKHIDQLVAYCATLAGETPGMPFYYYHIPALSGVHFPMIEFMQAAAPEIPNLAGIKFTHENLFDFSQCLQLDNRRFDILHGQDETLLCGLVLGATGGVGGTYNHIMGIYRKIKNAFDAGNLIEARAYQEISQKFIAVLIKYGGNVIAGKRMMKFLGLDCGPNRLPIRSLTTEEEKRMKRELHDIGFFEYANT